MSNSTRIILTVLAAFPLFCSDAYAAYLDVSPGWKIPQTVAMSEKTAISVVSECKAVSAYSNFSGKSSGSMIVAGPHPTETDAKIHLTVRLYKKGTHEKSCHVYIGKNNKFSSCNCLYVD
jgi:hypothetical protein